MNNKAGFATLENGFDRAKIQLSLTVFTSMAICTMPQENWNDILIGDRFSSEYDTRKQAQDNAQSRWTKPRPNGGM